MADDDKKTVRKVAVTNNDVGPRFINTARGQETVLKGMTLETEMNGYQIDSLSTEFVHDTDDVPRWEVEQLGRDLQPAGDQGKALTGLSVTALKKVAEVENVQLTGRTGSDGQPIPDATKAADIIAAIEAHREANPAA